MHQGLLGAEQVRVAHRAAHDAAQDISAPFVRRQHAIRQQERRGTQVIRNDAVARLALTLGLHAGQALRCCDESLEGIGIIIVMLTLHDGRDAFQPHAGVDRGLGQFGDDLARSLLELHEHEVPYLDEAIAILFR